MTTILVTNTIGLISSLVCIILFIFIASKNAKFMNRITLRLQLALSAVDLVRHIFFYVQKGEYSEEKCSFIGFSMVYLNSVYITIVVFVTLILHVNFLSSKRFNVNHEKFIWGAVAILPLIHNIPPLVLGMFGKDNRGFCYILMKNPNAGILTFTNLIVPTLVVFLYCLAIIAIILYKVRIDYSLTDRVINNHRTYDPNSSRLLQKLLQNWISRLIMYPAAFCLIKSGLVCDFFLQTAFGYHSDALFYWTAIGGTLSGLFNLIAFLLDPYFLYAFKKIWQSSRQKNATYPSSIASEAYSHEVKMADLNGALSGQSNNQSVNTIEINLNEDEAVALLQGCIKNC